MHMGVFLVEGGQAPVKPNQSFAMPGPMRLSGSPCGVLTKKPRVGRRRRVRALAAE